MAESWTSGRVLILFLYFALVALWSLLLLSNRLRKHDAARRGGVVSMAAEDAVEVILLLTGDKIILCSSSLC